MTDSIQSYRKAVRKHLRCCPKVKDRLIKKLELLLDEYIADHGNCVAEDLATSFGPAEDMAASLTLAITPEESKQYRTHRRIMQALLCGLAAFFLVFTIWLYFFKEVGLTSRDTVIIEDENTDSTYSFTEDDTP